MEQENAALRKSNQELQEQLNAIQEQFHNALAVTSRFDEIREQNKIAEERARSSQKQIDDLQNQLKIALSAKQDLEIRLQKATSYQKSQPLIPKNNDKLKKEKEELESKISDNNQIISQLTNKNAELSSLISESEANIKRIFTSASTYFHSDINSTEDLISQFIQPEKPTEPPPPEIIEKVIVDTKQVERYKRKYEKQTEAIKSLTDSFESEKESLLKQIKELQHQNAESIAKEEMTNRTLSQVDQDKKETLKEAQKRINELSFEVAQLRDDCNEKEATIQHQNEEFKRQLADQKDETEKAKNQLKQAIAKLQCVNKKRVELKVQVQNLQQDIIDLQAQEKTIINEKSDTEEENDHLREKVSTLQEEISKCGKQINELKYTIQNNSIENDHYKQSVRKLSEEIESQSAEIIRLQSERKELVLVNQKSAIMIGELEKKLAVKPKHVVEKVIEKVTIDSSCFDVSELPSEIRSIVSSIGKREELRDEVKIRQAVLAVFRSEEDEKVTLNKQISQLKSECLDIQNFVQSLFTDQTINLSDPRSCNLLRDSVVQKDSDFKSSKQRVMELERDLTEIILSLETKTVDEAKQAIANLKQASEDEKNLRKQIRNMKKELKNRERDLQNKIEGFETSAQNLEFAVQSAEDSKQKQNIYIAQLKKEAEEVEKEREIEREEFGRVRLLLENRLKDERAKREEVEIKLHEKETTLKKQEEVMKCIERSRRKKKAELEQLKAIRMREQPQSVAARNEVVLTRWQQTADELKKELERVKRENKELKTKLEKETEKRENAESKMAELDGQIERLNLTMKSKEEELRRERELCEGRRRAGEMKMEIEIERLKGEIQKQREEGQGEIMGEVGMKFSDYVTGKGGFGRECFSKLLDTVGSRLRALEENERKAKDLLGLNEHESIVDGISCVLLSNQ